MGNYITEKEVWKDVIGYEGMYQVSTFGRVRALEREIEYKNGTRHTYPEKILSARLDKYGYLRTNLYKSGKAKVKKIHRIVAESFIPNKDKKSTINHKDGNKLNNRVENLEWTTWGENNKHALDTGLRTNKNNSKSIPVRQYDLDGNFIKSYPSLAEAKRQTGIDHSNIGRACRTNGTAGGYRWRFKNSLKSSL